MTKQMMEQVLSVSFAFSGALALADKTPDLALPRASALKRATR